MGNEGLNLLKSAGKNIMNGIASELSESGITEALIKEGIPLNKLMMTSSKEKGAAKTNKNKTSNKKKQNKNKKEGKPENTKEKDKQPIQKKTAVINAKSNPKDKFSVGNVTTEQLRDAVIWSEILGKPVSRKRRNRSIRAGR